MIIFRSNTLSKFFIDNNKNNNLHTLSLRLSTKKALDNWSKAIERGCVLYYQQAQAGLLRCKGNRNGKFSLSIDSTLLPIVVFLLVSNLCIRVCDIIISNNL